MRIQFDINGELEKRFKRYCPNYKNRHVYAENALKEWINRQEGKDNRFQLEKLAADKKLLMPIIKDIIESGDIDIGRMSNVRL